MGKEVGLRPAVVSVGDVRNVVWWREARSGFICSSFAPFSIYDFSLDVEGYFELCVMTSLNSQLGGWTPATGKLAVTHGSLRTHTVVVSSEVECVVVGDGNDGTAVIFGVVVVCFRRAKKVQLFTTSTGERGGTKGRRRGGFTVAVLSILVFTCVTESRHEKVAHEDWRIWLWQRGHVSRVVLCATEAGATAVLSSNHVELRWTRRARVVGRNMARTVQHAPNGHAHMIVVSITLWRKGGAPKSTRVNGHSAEEGSNADGAANPSSTVCIIAITPDQDDKVRTFSRCVGVCLARSFRAIGLRASSTGRSPYVHERPKRDGLIFTGYYPWAKIRVRAVRSPKTPSFGSPWQVEAGSTHV